MSILTTGIRLTKRGILTITILFFFFFAWYNMCSIYIPQHVFSSSAENQLILTVSFNFVIFLTLLLARFIIHEFNEMRIILGCSILTSIVTTLLIFTSSIILRSLFFLMGGIFFSIGQLGSFVYFWNLTVPEERGRIGGLIGFFSLPLTFLVVAMAENLDFSGIILLSVILSSGTLVIKPLNPEKKEILITKEKEWGYQPERRTILFYSIPWIVFSLINATLAKNISLHFSQQLSSSIYIYLIVSQSLAVVLGALIGGIVADFFGRRLAIAFSLTLYGISSALAGLVMNYELLYLVYFANGLNWGILLTLYSWVVWGDLTNKESCIKRYSIGMIIYYLSMGIGFLIDKTLLIPLIFSSLLSCLLIFLSNIPILLAPELLSSDFRERIKMKLHMNILKRIGRKKPQNQG